MYQILKALLLPPASLLIGALAGHFWPGRAVTGRSLVSVCLLLLYALSTSIVSDFLMSRLERFPPLPAAGPLRPSGAQAIVVLSAEMRRGGEYPDLSPGRLTLERLRYGAWLWRRTRLPLLVSGGVMAGQRVSLAAVMRESLAEDFQVPVEWVEEQSADTLENAMRSAAILKARGITTIILVTHAWHLPRAKWCFERAGLSVIPAPTAFVSEKRGVRYGAEGLMLAGLPSARALQNSYFALHEMIGLLAYRLRAPAWA